MFCCIADDFTGATDIGALLAREGLDVALMIGVPGEDRYPATPDAMVIALKSRSIEPDEAVRQSVAAARWLRDMGANTLYFKYCSTFDSTDEGNIGPVSGSLASEWGENRVIFCPAFPQNGRTVYNGHLFVGDRLISETGMANHPLTPMRDPDLMRVLSRQSKGETVGLIDYSILEKGVDAVAAAIADGPHLLIADALSDRHLQILAEGAKTRSFATGGSAFGAAFARVRTGETRANSADFPRPEAQSGTAILVGSCSEATRRQLAALPGGTPHLRLDPATCGDEVALDSLLGKAIGAIVDKQVVVVSSSTDAAGLAQIQAAHGRQRSGELVEQAFAETAARLRDHGVRAFILAGGETSGAIVDRLGVRNLRIGPEIAPGVPWCHAMHDGGMWLALKSGNFGGDHFFEDARRLLMEDAIDA